MNNNKSCVSYTW